MNELIARETVFERAPLYFLILLEGFLTISVEILVIRQLLPFVGNNVIVTSLIIGIFLLFLALGYLKGSEISENYRFILKNNFTKTLFFLGIGLSYPFCEVFFYFFHQFFLENVLWILLIYLSIVIAPIVYFLGQTLPITTNLFRQENRVGQISGKALYLSTIGSFLGSVLTSLVFLNYAGVAATVFLNTCLLVLLIFLMEEKGGYSFYRYIGVIFLLFSSYYLNVIFESHIFIKTNNFANYGLRKNFVLEGKVGDVLDINHSISSFLTKDHKMAPYGELIKQIVFQDLKIRGASILIIGAGGFTLSAEGDFGNHISYLDIDKSLYSLVKKHYNKRIIGNFIPEDARLYLLDKRKMYDLIISDAFKSYLAIPDHLLTVEHIQHIQHALKPGGLAVFNLIANPLFKDPYSKHIDNTIQAVFPNCVKIPLNYQDRYVNLIYFCRKDDVEDKTVYTDNLNSINLDFFRAQIRGEQHGTSV